MLGAFTAGGGIKFIKCESKHVIVVLLLVGLLSSCAQKLSSRHQTVRVKTYDSDVDIYFDNRFIGIYEDKKKIDKRPTAVKVSKSGYLDQQKIIVPYKKNAPLIAISTLGGLYAGFALSVSGLEDAGNMELYTLSTIVGGTGALIIDSKRSSYRVLRYDRNIQFDSLIPIPVRDSRTKYLLTDRTFISIDSSDLTFTLYKHYGKYKDQQFALNEITNYKEFNTRSYGLSESLNKLLETHGLIDTNQRFFINNINNLLIDCEILKINIELVPGQLMRAKLRVNWRLKRADGVVILTKEISSAGNEFLYEEDINNLLDSALEHAMFQFINLDTVQQLISESEMVEQLAGRQSEVVKTIKRNEYQVDFANSELAMATLYRDGFLGNSCLISSDGYMISAQHVLDGDRDEIKARLGNEVYDVSVIRVDPAYDLVLLKVALDSCYYFNVEQETKGVADDIFVMGSLDDDLTDGLLGGIISSHREIDAKDYYQLDVGTSIGHSGSALLDHKGNLIGLVNGKVISFYVEGLGFAIPINVIMERLNIK